MLKWSVKSIRAGAGVGLWVCLGCVYCLALVWGRSRDLGSSDLSPPKPEMLFSLSMDDSFSIWLCKVCLMDSFRTFGCYVGCCYCILALKCIRQLFLGQFLCVCCVHDACGHSRRTVSRWKEKIWSMTLRDSSWPWRWSASFRPPKNCELQSTDMRINNSL